MRTTDVTQDAALPAGERAWKAFEAVARGRRAVREFSTEPVPLRDMNDVLDAAILAPTSSNLQPFELVWVRSQDWRVKLVRACMSQSAAKSAAELVVCVARWDRCEATRQEVLDWLSGQPDTPREVKLYYRHLVRWSYDQGPLGLSGLARRALLTPAAWMVPMPRGPASREDVRVWAIKSAALVCENLMLAARAKGLDTCPMEGADPVRVGRLVGLRKRDWRRSWDMTMVIAVGHRAPGADVGLQWRRERSVLVREV